MSLATNIQDLATRIATEIKLVKTYISGSGTGDVSALDTTATNLVAAINELHTEINAIVSGGGGDMLAATYDPQAIEGDAFARSNMTGTQTSSTISDFTSSVNALLVNVINDSATASGTTWSSTKIQSTITSAITAALEGEDLSDLADAIAALIAADAGLVSTSEEQTFNGTQLQQGQDNLQVYSRTQLGDPTTNFVTTFEAGLA